MANSDATKTLLILRHAKSSWGLAVDDHERPLAGRGKRDAVAVGEYLAAQKLRPGFVLCSTATRARQTWDRAVKGGAKAAEIAYSEDIYEAFAPELVRLIRKRTPESADTLLLLGHAPGIPELVDRLGVREKNSAAWNRLDTKYPTSGLAILSYRGTWADLSKSSATLLDFVVPRG